ncbi:MAG: hypothetical protein ACOC9P_01080 [bacterium]
MAGSKSDTTAPPPLEDQALYCPACGYDLRALAGESCPECGATVDRSLLGRFPIPWMRRGDEGRFRTFWRTVWQVSFRTRQLVEAAARPVDYREARRFQLTVVLWLVLSLALLVGAILLIAGWNRGLRFGLGWTVAGGLLVLGMLGGFLLTATGVHTYWLHSRRLPMEQQNRAVALGYYAAAPLAFVPPLALLMVAGWLMALLGEEVDFAGLFYAGTLIAVIGVGALAAVPVTIWRVALLIARKAAQREGPGLWTLALGLPVCWLGLAALWLIAVPGLLAWSALMIYSLGI